MTVHTSFSTFMSQHFFIKFSSISGNSQFAFYANLLRIHLGKKRFRAHTPKRLWTSADAVEWVTHKMTKINSLIRWRVAIQLDSLQEHLRQKVRIFSTVPICIMNLWWMLWVMINDLHRFSMFTCPIYFPQNPISWEFFHWRTKKDQKQNGIPANSVKSRHVLMSHVQLNILFTRLRCSLLLL